MKLGSDASELHRSVIPGTPLGDENFYSLCTNEHLQACLGVCSRARELAVDAQEAGQDVSRFEVPDDLLSDVVNKLILNLGAGLDECQMLLASAVDLVDIQAIVRVGRTTGDSKGDGFVDVFPGLGDQSKLVNSDTQLEGQLE